jgi:hypothetical protein
MFVNILKKELNNMNEIPKGIPFARFVQARKRYYQPFMITGCQFWSFKQRKKVVKRCRTHQTYRKCLILKK